MKFTVEQSFWEVFPDAKIGLILCSHLDNTLQNKAYYEALLKDAQVKAQAHLTKENFSDNDIIQHWREAYKKFKSKKGARSSIESLLKRVNQGNPLGSINPLVDLYNAVSLIYGLPCGGEDLDQFTGDVRLAKATGNELFTPLGSDEDNSPYEGEIVYKDDAGAICRCLNWRESVRTMLTEKTKNAVLFIELIHPEQESAFHEALNTLAGLVKDQLGGSCHIHVLTQTSNEVALKDE